MNFLRENAIKVAISIVFILILIGASLTYYNRQIMSDSLVIKAQSEMTLNAVDRIFENIQMMDISARGYALIREPAYLFHTVKNAKDYNTLTYRLLDSLLQVQQYDGMKQYEEVKSGLNVYTDWFEKMVNHLERDEMDAYLAMLREDQGKMFWQAFVPFLENINAFEKKINDAAQTEYTAAVNRNTFVQFLLVILGLPTLIWILYKLDKDEKKRTGLLINLDENNRKYLFDDGSAVKEQGEEILTNSIKILEKASNFVDEIAVGNYSVNWQGLDESNTQLNKANLAGKLTFMRDEMKRVKEEDRKRIWVTEGLSKFSELVRQHQNDLEALTSNAVSYLVKYNKCQQGSLFTLNEDESLLQLASCYAFDRKKFLQKEVKAGEGLLGQAYLEGATIVLKEIPKGYLSITSGLGDAPPNYLVIVPFRHNEKVHAILELAGFTEFEKYQLEFLEKAGEFVASAITSAQNATRTQLLMQQMKEQAEQMRAQEEELRQNLEELEATQEEMRRKELALERKLQTSNLV